MSLANTPVQIPGQADSIVSGYPMSEEAQAMAFTIEAVYEDGVLKPAEPLPLEEHAKVSVTVEPVLPPIWEQIIALTADAPPEEIAKVPPDGAAELDHYLYGAPMTGE
jgi:predicted DNA-binding antitoxin AbrB/MazE fold protein